MCNLESRGHLSLTIVQIGTGAKSEKANICLLGQLWVSGEDSLAMPNIRAKLEKRFVSRPKRNIRLFNFIFNRAAVKLRLGHLTWEKKGSQHSRPQS